PPIGQGVEELGELSSFPRRLDSSEGLILGEMEDLLAEVLHRGIALRQIELAKIGLGNENEDLRFVPPAVGNPLEELLENLRIGQMNRGMLSHGNAPSGARSRGLSLPFHLRTGQGQKRIERAPEVQSALGAQRGLNGDLRTAILSL